MKNRIIKWVMFLAAAFLTPHIGNAQGFVNLDFENADLSAYGAGSVPVANAIPGWTAYLGGTSLTNINYTAMESIKLNGFEVDIMGTAVGATSIQGNYFIYLQGSLQDPAAIGQTGTIPITAQSLVIWGMLGNVFAFPLSFNGNILHFNQMGQTANYGIYSADISAFAGQTGQLLFTSIGYPGGSGDAIDNIQFSSLPVPEPASRFLLFLGGGVLFYVRTRRKRHSAPARLD
jgi:hypothetical protein